MYDDLLFCGIVRHVGQTARGMSALVYACGPTIPSYTKSLERELEVCRYFAAQRGYEIDSEYAEARAEARAIERPRLWAAIDALKPGSVLLVPHLRILTADFYESEIIERAIVDAGARLVSAAGESDWPDTDAGQSLRKIFRLHSALSRAALRSRQEYAQRARWARRQAPFGWRRDNDDPTRLVAVPSEQEAITQVLLLSKCGLGLREIVRSLERAGRPPRGKRLAPRHSQANPR